MRATKYLVGAAAVAVFACAAPAAAQYYPGYGYPGYGYGGGNVIGQVLNDVLGTGYGNYGANSQVAVNQCAAAVQSRLNGGYGGYGYNSYANSGRYAAYGYNAYSSQGQVDLTWKCRADYRGFVRDIDINRAQPNYGYGYNNGYSGGYTTPYNQYDYSQYGYRRY
jgi:hypothetical protein